MTSSDRDRISTFGCVFFFVVVVVFFSFYGEKKKKSLSLNATIGYRLKPNNGLDRIDKHYLVNIFPT